MSDLINITDYIENIKNTKELRTYANKQYEVIISQQEKIKALTTEIAQLKEYQQHPIEKVIVSKEEALIDVQIGILNDRSLSNELSLDDVKKLDLLLKNKNILREQGKVLPGESKEIDSITEAKLIELAEQNKSNEQINS